MKPHILYQSLKRKQKNTNTLVFLKNNYILIFFKRLNNAEKVNFYFIAERSTNLKFQFDLKIRLPYTIVPSSLNKKMLYDVPHCFMPEIANCSLPYLHIRQY